MAGIYIHIPFCRQACHYCDFHFSVSLKGKADFLHALKDEMRVQKEYFGKQNVSTVYFGGGTPSVLSGEEIGEIFGELSEHFSIDKDAEVTLEANPDDLTTEKLKELSQTPVNRLSIGIQSFRDEDLKFLNRIHSAMEAVESVKNAKQVGFENITIDLIYGIQTLTNDQWRKNIEQAMSLGIPHISCYSLTIEPGTALQSFIKSGKIKNADPEKSAEQFEMLMNEMEKNSFIHYEISNFCMEGAYSKHNSNYWRGEKYLGLGPSAHSFNGESRQWNVKSNAGYIRSLAEGKVPFEIETLTESQRYNEYILTSLRTKWGADTEFVRKSFGPDFFAHLHKEVGQFLKDGLVVQQGDIMFLSRKGKLFADRIASDLFRVS